MRFQRESKLNSKKVTAEQGPSIIADESLPFSPHVNAMFPQEIIGKCKAHILLIPMIVSTVKKQVTLLDSDSKHLGYIKVNAVTYFGHQSLFCLKYITTAKA